MEASLKRERGNLSLVEPKTARSRRPLALPGPVATMLRTHRRRQREERLAAGAAWTETGLVFTTEVGTPIDPSNLRRATRRLTIKAGVPDVSPNELARHSAASLLYDASVPLDVIADLLGHASTRMLEQHYRHRIRKSINAHVAPMELMFAAATPAATHSASGRDA